MGQMVPDGRCHCPSPLSPIFAAHRVVVI
jgi:hypothetical protein